MSSLKRKPVEVLRVPLNCLISPGTKELLTGIQNGTRESQGEIVDRAIALLATGEEIEPRAPKQKVSRRELATQSRAASDVLAQSVERDDIDYSHVDSVPVTNVARLASRSRKLPLPLKGDTLNNWRRNRKPLLKPKERG